MLFRLDKLMLLSYGGFRLYKVIKSSQQNVLKISRVVSNSGCLVAGCCFSRQSDDEESLLHEGEKNQVIVDASIKPNHYSPSYSTSEVHRKPINMKRSFEFINSEVSRDISSGGIAVHVPTECDKKRKIADDSKNDVDKIKLSDTANESLPSVIEAPEAEKKEPSKRLRPNYFVAVKISNHKIHENLKNVQNHILKNESNLKRSMLELKTLHITLMVMHIGDSETHARAMTALKSIHQEHDKEMSDNPLQLEFKGLGHFQNRVLYAKISADDSYERLCNLAESVKKHFEANAIFTTDKRSQFTPHLTVAKIDFKKKQNRGIRKINAQFYKDYVDDYFGSQTIESIQLLSMTDPKNNEGYYSGDEIYFSAFDPNNCMNALCGLLEVDKKKNDIKEAISSLMKEKLK